MKSKYLVYVMVFAALLATAALTGNASAQETHTGTKTALDFDSYACGTHLFKIAKSDNKNVLFYDAVIKNGKLDSKNPVDIYWIMYAEKNQREGMTILEKPQFGIITKEIASGKEYVINVKNDILAKRDIRVFTDNNGCARATAVIDGKDALIQDIFINIKPGGGLIPKVESLDLHGIAMADQSNLSERVYNK